MYRLVPSLLRTRAAPSFSSLRSQITAPSLATNTPFSKYSSTRRRPASSSSDSKKSTSNSTPSQS